MSQSALDVRLAVASYLDNEAPLSALHEVAASVFMASSNVDPDASLVAQVYGLVTDAHAGLIAEDALRRELRELLKSPYNLTWSLMAESLRVTTAASDVTASSPVNPLGGGIRKRV